jgi:Putative zinc-finger
MTSCKRAGELLSQSLDAELSPWQRLALALHLCGCRWCRLFRRQLRLVEEASRRWGRSDPTTGAAAAVPALSPEARERIQSALRQAKTEGQL